MRISRSGFWITQIKNVGGRVFQRLLVRSGVDAFNGPQGRILDALWQGDGISSREISQRTGLASSTLTSMIDRMEAQGLVVRMPSPRDRRAMLIFLTEAAKRLQEEYEKVSQQMTDVYFRGFTDDEVTRFEGYLQRVLHNIEEEAENE